MYLLFTDQTSITSPAEQSGEVAQMNIVRRTVAAEEGSPGVILDSAFFIELLPGTRVTVNGATYINENAPGNEDGEGDASEGPSPFFIGPLHTYTVIEFLSQPVFFFRRRSDLNFTQKVAGRKAKPSREELENRDTRGVAEGLDIAIVWTPLATPSVPAPVPQVPALPIAARPEDINNNKSVESVVMEQSPCAQLQASLENLEKGQGTGSDVRPLEAQEVLDSITAVTEVVNRRHAPSHKIAVVDYRMLGDDGIPEDLSNNDFILVPWTSRSHTKLAIIRRLQREEETLDFHVVDSAPWTHNYTARGDIHTMLMQVIRKFSVAEDNQIPSGTQWAWGSRQGELWHGPYYTIMNAWSTIFGMKLSPNFRPSNKFFAEAFRTIQATLAGDADWKLIWSLLVCHGFATSERPGAQYQFQQTAPGPADTNMKDVHSEGSEQLSEVAHAPNNTMFEALRRVLHNNDLPWDDWEEVDVDLHLPAIQRAGATCDIDNRSMLRAAYNSIPQQSGPDFPSDIEPCAHFRKEVNILVAKEETQEQFGLLVASGITAEPKLFLEGKDVSLAIASVTGAVTAVQDMTAGFSSMSQSDVDILQHNVVTGEQVYPMQSATRFRRPMLFPVIYNNHIVLAVVQFNNDRVEIDVIDSRAHHHKHEHRKTIFDIVLEVWKRSNWTRTLESEQLKLRNRITAFWHDAPQQPGSAECGYYTILSAWALALGLTPNPNFHPHWYGPESNDEQAPFFRDLQDMIFLVRLGLADWKLVYAFLRCNRFVYEGVVPEDRRFTKTVPLMDERAHRAHLAAVRVQEEEYWSGRQDSAAIMQTISGSNRISWPKTGRPHNNPFETDSWDDLSVYNEVNDLEERGQLPLDYNDTRLRQYHEERMRPNKKSLDFFTSTRVRLFITQLQRRFGAETRVTRDQIIQHYADFWTNTGFEEQIVSQIGASPGVAKRELHRFWYDVMQHPATQHAFTDLPVRACATPNNQRFDSEQAAFAINAVVQAIDRHQFDLHKRSPSWDTVFSGGFALALDFHIELARGPDSDMREQEDAQTSRPRRCWMLPMTVSSDQLQQWYEHRGDINPTGKSAKTQAHSFLAVVQQDGDGFSVFFLDSSRGDVFALHRNALFQMVVHTAYSLKWPTHRNEVSDDEIVFNPKLHVVTVPSQLDHHACSLHTVLNAWILALGLTPNPAFRFNEGDYNAVYQMVRTAVAGLLNWKDIAVWLLERGVVVERNVDQIPEDRRFNLSTCQVPSEQLGDYMQQVRNTPDELQLSTELESECPYDESSSVNWTKATIRTYDVDLPTTPRPSRTSTPAPDVQSNKNSDYGGEKTDNNGNESFSQSTEEGDILQWIYNRLDRKEWNRIQTLHGAAYEEAIETAQMNLLFQDSTAPQTHQSAADSDIDAEGEDDDPSMGLNRCFDEPRSLKRRHDGDVEVPRKKVRFDLGCGVEFANEVDKDGDTKMTGSPWRRARGELAFLDVF